MEEIKDDYPIQEKITHEKALISLSGSFKQPTQLNHDKIEERSCKIRSNTMVENDTDDYLSNRISSMDDSNDDYD